MCPAGSGVVVRARPSRSASPDRVSCVVGFGRRVRGRREGIHPCRFPSRGTWKRLSRPARPGADRVVRFPVQGNLQGCMPSYRPDTRRPDPTSNTTRSGGAHLPADGRTTSHDASARTPAGPKLFENDNTATEPPPGASPARLIARRRLAACTLARADPSRRDRRTRRPSKTAAENRFCRAAATGRPLRSDGVPRGTRHRSDRPGRHDDTQEFV